MIEKRFKYLGNRFFSVGKKDCSVFDDSGSPVLILKSKIIIDKVAKSNKDKAEDYENEEKILKSSREGVALQSEEFLARKKVYPWLLGFYHKIHTRSLVSAILVTSLIIAFLGVIAVFIVYGVIYGIAALDVLCVFALLCCLSGNIHDIFCDKVDNIFCSDEIGTTMSNAFEVDDPSLEPLRQECIDPFNPTSVHNPECNDKRIFCNTEHLHSKEVITIPSTVLIDIKNDKILTDDIVPMM